MNQHRERQILAVLIIAAFTLRLGLCAVSTGPGQSQPKAYREYSVTAERLIRNGSLLSPLILDGARATPTSHLPPVYIFIVAGIYRLLGVETFGSVLTLQAINAAATAIVVLVVFRTTWQVAGRQAAWLAGVLVSVNPLLIRFTNYVWDTSLFALTVSLSVWIAWSLGAKRDAWWRWWLFGCWLGVVALLNPALTLTYPVLVLWPLTRIWGWRLGPLSRGAAVALLGWLLIITPWLTRNYVQQGRLMYVRGGLGLELWLGVCPEADQAPQAVFSQRYPLESREEQERILTIGEEAYYRECGERAITAICGDPWRFARLAAVRAVDYWAGTLFSITPAERTRWPKEPARFLILMFCSAETLIVATGIFRRRMNRDGWWLIAIVITFSIIYISTHVALRYRAAAEPVMATLVAMAVFPGHRVGSMCGSGTGTGQETGSEP